MNKLVRMIITGGVVLSLLLGLSGCAVDKSKTDKVRIAVLYDEGTTQDSLYNDRIYDGVAKAEEKFGDKVEIVNLRLPQDSLERRMAFLENSVKNGNYALVIDSDLHYLDQSREIAKKYPHTVFAVIDDNLYKNVESNYISVNFDEKQQGFIAGCIAALSCNDGAIGVLDAEQDINPGFALGVSAGIKYVNPAQRVIKKSLASLDSGSGVLEPSLMDESYQAASTLYASGCAVVIADWQINQKSVLHAAFLNHKLMIGCDVDLQKLSGAWSKNLLASVVKNYDTAVMTLVERAVQGKLKGEIDNYSLSNNGISYDEFKPDKLSKIEPQLKKIIEGLKNGSIKV